MKTACLSRQLCLGDQPGANLSSEAPDEPVYIGENTGWDHNAPPIGGDWATSRCYVIFESTVSQADADAQAAAAQLTCLVDPDPGNGGPGTVDRRGRIRNTGSTGWQRPVDHGQPPSPGPQPPPGPNIPLYSNDEQSCTSNCPDGNTFSVKEPGGFVKGFTKEFANSVAKSLACYDANNARLCFGTIKDFACFQTGYASVLIVSANHLPLKVSLAGGNLPDGISLTQIGAASALLNGTTQKADNFAFTLQALDAHGTQVQHDFTIMVMGLANDTDVSYPDGQVGEAYIWTFESAGGRPPRKILGAEIPPGLILTPDGVLAGVPGEPGVYGMTITVEDSHGWLCPLLTPISISPALERMEVCAHAAYSKSFDFITYVAGPIAWQTSGMPGWMTATVSDDTHTITVHGTAGDPGDGVFIVGGSDFEGNILEFQVELGVVGFTDETALSPAHLGKAYSYQLHAAGCLGDNQTGNPDFTYSLVSGNLPAGLSLNSAGVISGTATGSIAADGQTFTFTVHVTTWSGKTCGKQFTIACTADYLDFNDMVWEAPHLVHQSGSSDSTGIGGVCAAESTSGAAVGQQTPPPVQYTASTYQLGFIDFPVGKDTPVTVTITPGLMDPGCTYSIIITSSLGGYYSYGTGSGGGTFTAHPGRSYTIEVRTHASSTYDYVLGYFYYTSGSVQVVVALTAPSN